MKDFSVRKQILWSSENAPQVEVTRKEREMILIYESNNPVKGYNQRLP
jgi:hypothetical protein